MQKITPCLWFDDQAEQAVEFYTGIFKQSRVLATAYYGEAGQEVHRKPPGSVMTIAFELDGQRYTALNGGPLFAFSEAISFQVSCASQDEVDYYWEQLGAGGPPEARQCGWLKDKYGVSWQVVPDVLSDMLKDSDTERAQRVMLAMLKMQKLDIASLQRAYAS